MTSDLIALRAGDLLLERFRIDAVYEGGMGLLWATTDAQTGRRYALKTIRPELAGDDGVRDAFRREAETWIALDRHEHLVQAFWLIEREPVPFLVLEFIDGQDLSACMAGQPLRLERALDFAMQCAAGMAYAHTRELRGGVGVLHRDLKPSNLLVTDDDQLKVTDFGLARVFRDQVTAAGASAATVGTLAYMAPEQLRGSDSVDRRADIYAFGLVLHEMLTGRNPLEAGSVPEQIRRILNDTPAPLADVPDALRALVSRCVAKDPDERPRDFEEVLATLAGIARGLRHDWHIDPAGIEPPRGPTSLVVEDPRLRPRRPHAGEPFALELAVRGDVGPGPVEVIWDCPIIEGVEILTPRRREEVRVDVGGATELVLRIRAVATREGSYTMPASLLTVRGPRDEVVHSVAAKPIDVAFAFHQPLVGREAETEVLHTAVADVARGEGGLVLILGAAGSGRSRLLRECERMTGEANVRSIHSRAALRDARPMRLLHDTARELLSLSRGTAQSVRAAVNTTLGEYPTSARYFAETLLGGMPVEGDAPVVQHWFTLVREAAATGPLVLLLDNLDRADEVVARLTFEIAARSREQGVPVLIVATASAGAGGLIDEMRLWEKRGLRVGLIELDPLRGQDLERLVEEVFPGQHFDEEAPWFVPILLEVTAGNPQHATEVLRLLRRGEERLVMREGDAWRPAPALTPERLRALVPAGVEEATRARLRGLSGVSFELLATAALIGDEFETAVLRAAARDPSRVESALVDWEGRGLIRSSDALLDRYRFWTAVVTPVVERLLAEEQPELLRSLHGRVADALLGVHDDDEGRTRHALAVADHLRAAGREEESIRYTLRGSRRLIGMALSARARQRLESVRGLVEREGSDELQRAKFDFLYGLACESSGAYEEALHALRRFIRFATSTNGFRRHDLARAHARLGHAYRARGEYDEALSSLEDARTILERIEDHRALAFIQCSLGALALERGDLAEADTAIAEARRMSEERGNEGAAIQARILEGRLALAMRETTAARNAFTDARARAHELGDRRRRAEALRGLGAVDLETGYVRQAREHLSDAIELHAVMGDRAGLASALVLLGDVHRDAGRSDLALHSYRRALRVFREIGQPEGEAEALFHAGRVLRMRARTAAAVRDLAASAELYARLRHPARAPALSELAFALAESNAERPARLALARADRAWPPGYERRAHRVVSRALRARMALARGDLRLASVLADRARRHASRTTGHRARIVAHRIAGEVALRRGDLVAARRDAESALAFARESGHLLESLATERILLELDARAGREAEAGRRAHRIARVYGERVEVGGEPWRLLMALVRGLSSTNPARSAGYRRAAERCATRLEARGFRAPE